MRTIKFKGKSIEDGQWNYGDLSHVADQTLIKNNPCRDGRPKFTFEVDPQTVCQFTGFHDKNGKEIYEGDVIHIGPDYCVVIWVEDLGGFYPKVDYAKLPCTSPLGAMLRRCDIEVIGNIYEQKWTMLFKVSQRKEEEGSND